MTGAPTLYLSKTPALFTTGTRSSCAGHDTGPADSREMRSGGARPAQSREDERSRSLSSIVRNWR